MTYPSTRSDLLVPITSNSTSWSINLANLVIEDGGGSKIVAGDLILINIGRDGTSGTGTISGYTSIFDQPTGTAARGLSFVKVATAGDASSPPTISYAPGASEQGVVRVAVIKDWFGSGEADGTGVAVSTANTGTDNLPDPPNLAPSWASTSVNTYWRAVFAHDNGLRTTTGYPTNYTIFQNADASGGGSGAGLGSAGRQNSVASDNPATFTLDTADDWVAWLIAIRPSSLQTVGMNFKSSGTSVFNPTVSPGPVTVVTNFISASTSVFGPLTVVYVAVPLLASSTTISAPSTIHIIGANLLSETALFAPTAINTQQVVTDLLSETVIYAPQVAQEQLVGSNFISASTSVFAPNVALTLQANLIGPTGTIFTPDTINLAIGAPFISSATVINNPSIEIFIVADLLGPTSVLFAPTAIPDQFVNTNLISNTALYNPTVTQVGAPLTVDMLLLISGAIYSPTAIQEQFVSANALGPTGTLLDPAVSMTILAVGPIGGATVFAPTLIPDQVVIAQLILTGQLFDPAISAGKDAEPPFDLVLKHRFNQLRQGKSSGLLVKKRLGN